MNWSDVFVELESLRDSLSAIPHVDDEVRYSFSACIKQS